MIRCIVCQGRVRPPPRPWAVTDSGSVHFYESGTPMVAYEKELARLAKKLPFIHERCKEAAAPGTLPERFITALDLDARLRHQQQKGEGDRADARARSAGRRGGRG